VVRVGRSVAARAVGATAAAAASRGAERDREQDGRGGAHGCLSIAQGKARRRGGHHIGSRSSVATGVATSSTVAKPRDRGRPARSVPSAPHRLYGSAT